jgi:hypothetical protein
MTITFNGQEYASREAMPEDVRQAYDDALAMLRHAHPGVEDTAGLDADHKVIDVKRNISIKFDLGGTDGLPPPIRRMVESGLGIRTGERDREAPDPLRPLHTTMGLFMAFMAGFVFVFAMVLMFAVGGGRSHLPGRLSVAVVALLLLGWMDRMATRLARRREPVLGPDSPEYRRFIKWSAAGLATAAVLLLGVAWYLP